MMFLSAAQLDGQELYFQSMAARLKLPSDECYTITQDHRGYMWISTDNGLCRYNGNTSKIYNDKNGLPERAVYFINEDRQKQLNIITSTGKVLNIRNDSIHEFPFTKTLAACRRSDGDNSVVYNVSGFTTGKDLIVTSYASTYKIDASGRTVKLIAPDSLNCYDCIDLNASAPYIIKRNWKHKPYVRANNAKLFFLIQDTVLRVTYKLGSDDTDGRRILVSQSEDFVFVAKGLQLIRLNKRDRKIMVYNFSDPVLHLSFQAGGLWVGLRKSGLRYYPRPEDMENEHKGLVGLSVSSVCVDKEGAIWCTTLEKNVFYCRAKDIIYYPDIKELITRTSFMKASGDTLLTSTKFDELLIFYKNRLSRINARMGKTTGELTDAVRFKQHWYICSKGNFLKMDKFLKNATLPFETNKTATTFLQLDTFSGRLCGMSYSTITEIEGKYPRFDNIKLGVRAKSFLYYNEDVIYVGCVDGLYKVNVPDHAVTKLEGISCEITILRKIASGEVLIGTKGNGLWVLEQKQVKRICRDTSACAEIIFEIEQDKDGVVWLATNNGLVKLNKAAGGTYHRVLYNTSHGMLSNNIYDVAVIGKRVYASTKDGIFSFPAQADLHNHVAPGVFINSVKVNGAPCGINSSALELPYNKNSIEIGFDLLAFGNEEKSDVLLYQLSGSGDSLKGSSDHALSFNNLSPDNYELIVYALNNDGVKSTQPVRFKFTIHPPFWNTWWFALIVVCFTALLVILIIKRVVKNIRHKERETARINKLIAESQLSALQAQMNPHFIFNAINSIQNYILKQEEKKAFEYLGTFSKLIRMVLNHSRRTSVSLSEELALLKLYIELEQLRFKNAFSFDLSIADDLDPDDVQIPAMLIQPYIENAIWHGLMSLGDQRDALLKLDFTKKDNLLRIIIEDNGIGREQANTYKAKNTPGSLAMELTGKRLEMINGLRGRGGLKADVTDLKDANENACGTRVELLLILEMDEFYYH